MADPAPGTAPVSAVNNPAPIPIKNSFTGMVLAFPNGGIHTLVAAALQFRKQLTVRPERMSQGGWNDELNVFMGKGLNLLDKHRARITYNSASTEMDKVLGKDEPGPNNSNVDGPVGGTAKDQDTMEKTAADPTSSLLQEFSDNAPDVDNVLTPSEGNRQVSGIFDGSDLNLPQLDPINCPNNYFRAFILGLDSFVVQATRLDSRTDPNTIAKYESVMLRGMLSELWTILKVFGGEKNRADVPTGTLPNDEANTFGGGFQIVEPAKTNPTGA